MHAVMLKHAEVPVEVAIDHNEVGVCARNDCADLPFESA
jgi:hypothetical protein